MRRNLISRPTGCSIWGISPRRLKPRLAFSASVSRKLTEHRIRRLTATEVLTILRQPAVTVAPGTAQAAVTHIEMLAARVQLVNLPAQGDLPPARQAVRADRQPWSRIPSRCEASDPLSRRDHQALRNLCGVAPVTRRSGKRCVVGMRRAAHVRLRLALYHWSRVAIQHDVASRSRYAQLRERGHSHPRALRNVADRLLNVACAMLRDGTLFNPEAARKLPSTA